MFNQMKYRLIIIAILLSLLSPDTSWAQQAADQVLVINGGDYAENYAAFIQTTLAKNAEDQINLLILPSAITSNVDQISATERGRLLETGELTRSEMEQTCYQVLPPDMLCSIKVLPVFTRSDAEKGDWQSYFDASLDGIYLLAGDPEISLSVLKDTPLQKAINEAYRQGVVISGGAADLYSAAVIHKSGEGSHLDSVFNFGALSVSDSSASLFLDINLPGTFVLTDIFEGNQLGSLLRAVTFQGAPSIGIGLESRSALQITKHDQIIAFSAGSPSLVLDATTYHAALSLRYTGAFQPVGASNILAHWLAPGEHGFQLTSRQHSLAAPPDRIDRNTQPLRLPDGAGSLFVSSDLLETMGLNNAASHFINLAGGKKAKLLLLAAGYQDPQEIQELASYFEGLSDNPLQILDLTNNPTEPLEISDEITGIVISAAMTPNFDPIRLQPAGLKWRSGLPVWVNHAAASWIGTNYVIEPGNPGIEDNSFFSKQDIQPGLSWLPVSIQTLLWDQNHWHGIYSQAYHYPKNLVVGLPSRSGLEISNLGARVWGEDAILTLDFSQAILLDGSAANSLIDIFAPQEMVSFQHADQDAEPIAASTPALPTATYTQHVVTPTDTPTPAPTFTSTPVPTETQRIRPTATIKPTHTPPPIPPPPDPARMNFMIVITIFMVVIILFGIWLNREWMKDNH